MAGLCLAHSHVYLMTLQYRSISIFLIVCVREMRLRGNCQNLHSWYVLLRTRVQTHGGLFSVLFWDDQWGVAAGTDTERKTVYYTTGPRDRRHCTPRRAIWGHLRVAESRKEQGESWGCELHCGFLRKVQAGRVNSLGLVSLHTFLGCWAKGVVLSCLEPGPGMMTTKGHWSMWARERFDPKAI